MGIRGGLPTVAERGVGTLRSRSDLLLPLFSLARVVPAPGSVFGRAVGFGVLSAVFYALAPRVFPARLGMDDDAPFRALFAAVAVAFSVSFTWTRSSLLGGVAAFGTFFGAVVCFDAYLARRKGWDLLDVDGEAVALVDGIAPNELRDELRKDLDRTGWRRRVAVWVWLGALGTFFAVPALLAGLFGVLVGTAFPFPDVLLLAVVAFDGVTRTEYATDVFDAKERLYSGVGAATRSLDGGVFVFLTGYGVLLSARVLATASRLATDATRGRLPGATDASALWNSLGVVTVLVAVGAYDFWVWVRAIDRLPDALDISNDESAIGRSVPPYPRGLTVPPTLVLVALALFLPLSSVGPSRAVTFALVWPFLLVCLGWCAVSTLSSSGTTSTVEIWVVVAALVVQLVGSVVAFSPGGLFAAVTDPLVLFSLVVVPLVAYLPTVVRYATRHDDVRRYATGGYVLYLGVVTAVVSMTASGTFAVAIRVGSAVILCGGAVLVAAESLFS